MRKSMLILALFAVLILAAFPVAAQDGTVVDIAANDDRFETLVTALTNTGLDEVLAGEGPFTVFAPTDDAFATLPDGVFHALLLDIPALTTLLTYHVAPGSFLAADVAALTEIGTLEGTPITVEVTDSGVVLNGSVNVTVTDIVASNGVIHVIDAVLLPEALSGLVPVAEATAEPMNPDSIAGIASADGSFSVLVAALQATGLDNVLAGEGSYTVFAPTDAAFAAVDVDSLLDDPSALTDILLYHVVPGTVLAADVAGMHMAETLAGAPVYISVTEEGGVVLNGSVNVVSTDIIASNGVIHVIDSVLLPPVTGLYDLYLANVDTALLAQPGGMELGGVIATCQTAIVFRTVGGFGLTNFGGWINLADATPVAPDYGQEGGQPIAEQCAA